MKKFFSKKSAKIVCSFLMTVCMLLALFPLSGGFKACALTEGEIFYVDTHSNAVNSFTGGAYRSGGNTVRFLKTKTNEKNMLLYSTRCRLQPNKIQGNTSKKRSLLS